MSDGLGLISYQGGEGPRPYSNYTGEKIDQEVRKIVDQCFAEIKQLIKSKRDELEK